jgi:2-polyprenyl-3-methyl-5-hydroxy-6-metoxy-1,4-benzoquinol methylase
MIEQIKCFICHSEQDSDTVKQLKAKFSHKKRACHYGCGRSEVDGFVLEAAPGVIETIVTDIGFANKNEKTKLLNLGGGVGQLTSIFEYLGYDVTNTDIAIENQDEKNIKVDFNNTDLLPLPEKSFDIVLCQEVIEHIENPWRLLRMARKYLKEGGLLYLTTPNIHSIRSKKCFAKTNYFIWFQEKNLSYHINPLPFWEIKMMAKKSGYQFINFKGSGDYFFSRNNKNEDKILKNNDILIFQLLAV